MPQLDLKNATGKKDLPAAINEGIRMHCHGGKELIEAIVKVNKLADDAQDGYLASSHELRHVLDILRSAKREMEDFVLDYYKVTIKGRTNYHDSP